MPVDDSLIDDPAQLLARDDGGLLRATATAGAQVREMIDLTGESGALRLAAGGAPRSLVVAGDRETGHAAALVTALAGRHSACPVIRLGPGPLPNWVGAADLVVVADLARDGDSELALLTDAAARRGAALLGIGRAGTALHERCTWARAPFLAVPAERPDGALWSLLTPIVLLARELRLTEGGLDGTARALDAMAELCRPDSESFVNPAKSLALQLASTLPVIVADSPAMAVVADRLRSSLARLAGIPSALAGLPEALDEASAYLTGVLAPAAAEQDVFRDRVEDAAPALRMLTVRDEPAAGGRAREAMRELLRRAEYAGVPVSDLAAEGRAVEDLAAAEMDRVGRLAALIALADFTCCYLRLSRT